MKHFLARVVCLILLPVVLYMAIFYVHLKILKFSGEEDEFFSTTFQISLEGNYFRTSESVNGISLYNVYEGSS